MNVKACKGCKRLFNYIMGQNYCPACKEKLEEKFQEVKRYIQKNTGVGIQEVATACDVETSQIRQWLREDRLELATDSALYLNCESCGQPIRSGKFCEKCKANMTKELQSVIRTNKPAEPKTVKDQKDNAKMRYLK